MNILQKIFDFILNHSIWVAISVVCLTQISSFNLNITISKNLLFFVGFGTIAGYNFIKHYQPQKIQLHLNIATILNVISTLLCMYFFLQLKINTQIAIVIPFLITLFYAIPFGKKSLRNLAGLKIYAIAFCWVWVTVILPIINADVLWSTAVFLEIVQRFVFVIAITLPFEIRDVQADPENLHTIPQQFGVNNTKIYGLFLLMIFFFLTFFKDTVPHKNLTILPLIFLCSLLFIMLAKKTQTKYYSSFFVEGIPILWLLLWLIL